MMLSNQADEKHQSKRQVKVVLVDVDGTLIDTNDAHAHAWVEAFAEAGHPVTFEQIRPLMGMGGDQIIPHITGISKDTEEGKKIAAIWSRIFNERYLPKAQPFSQAKELLVHLHHQGIKLVAASSGEKELANALLGKVGVRDLLTTTTSSADAKRSKPAPDIIQAALKKSGFNAEEAILIGDTSYDIEASAPVGVGVIAFRCGGSSDESLAGALAIYDGPGDLLAHWDDSVFAVKQ